MDRLETGQRIARARRRRGLSQAVLAALVGRSESWLSQVERGKRGIDHRYQATRYEEASRLLPSLIRDTEAASRAAGPDHPELCRIRAHVYDATAALLNRVGEHALAWTAADRAISAAEQSGLPLITALGAYRLTYVLASRKHPREAVELAMTAAAALDQTMSPSLRPEQLSICGGLYLAAANAAAAQYDSSTSASLLRTAGRLAEQLGRDANLMGTAFGPVNVAIHAMSASARLGDWTTVVTIGESLDATTIPAGLIGRRTQVNLDLARAYAMRRQDAAAVNALLAAEQLSPQLVRFDSSTRDVISGLLHREHRASTPQLRPLARRAGII